MNCEKKEEEGAKSIAEQKTEVGSEPQNVTKPAVDRDQIEQSRDHGQQVMAEGSLAQGDDNLTNNVPKGNGLPPLPSFDDLRPQDRVKNSELGSSINKALVGKWMLCKTIREVLDAGAVVLSVTDPQGEDAVGGMTMALYNYSSIPHDTLRRRFDEILPFGSFMVVKNPLLKKPASGFGSYVWHSENPAEVELISRKRVEAKFPDLEWYKPKARGQQFWGGIEGDEAALAKLMEFGNKGFVDKRFTDAIRFYNMALDYCGENPGDEEMVQSNKCAALLALGCFNSALKCAEVALEIDPGNEKYSYRKTKALIGLRKYEEALNFLESKFEQFPSLGKSDDCKTLLGNVKFLASRGKLGPTESQLLKIHTDTLNNVPEYNGSLAISKIKGIGRGLFATFQRGVKFLCSRKNLGPTESKLMSLDMKNLEDNDKIPEFTGPLALTSQAGRKGRGLVATEDIRPGQLLICAKAFCLELTPPSPPIPKTEPDGLSEAEMNKDALGIEDMETVFAKGCDEQAVKSIANKLLFDPELGPEFYSLSAGAKLGNFEPGDARAGHVDMKRINEILRINAFGSDRAEKGNTPEFTGLWILPSYFNHSCSEYNCSWSICGEWMMVKAIAEIKKGEELTLSYKSPIVSYGARHHYFSSLGFSCTCKLCRLEANEPVSIKKERKKILKFVGEITSKSSEPEIKMALKEVEKLASLRKNSVALNFPLLSPQIARLADTLFCKDRFDDCISVLNQMFLVASTSVRWHDDGIYVATKMLDCYAAKKERELSKVWIATVKRLMMKFHGSLELMRVNNNNALTLQLLRRQLGMDFFQED